MASRGPSWTSWKWNDEHQKYRRQLKDHKGKVLEEEFGIQRQTPRKPPVIGNYLQQPEGELEATSENYELESAGALGSSQDSPSQWEGSNTPSSYGTQSADEHKSSNLPINFQNYGNTASTYGSRGFAAAQNPLSGYHGQPGNPQGPRQALGRDISYSQFNPQLSAIPTTISQPPQYSYLSGYLPSPTPQYQSGVAQGQTWQTEYRKHYGGNSGQLESHGSQHHDRVVAEQSSPPGFKEKDSTPEVIIAPSGLPVKSPETLETPNYETPSTSAQDETSSSLQTIVGKRRQSSYHGYYRATLDSSAVEPGDESEPENADAYDDDPDGDEEMEVATYRKASQKSKVYQSKNRPSERKEGSRSRSRPPLSGVENPGSYSEEPFMEVARGTGVDQQSDTSPSLPQESKESRKSSTRIPPKGFDRRETDEEVSMPRDMTKTAHRHRRGSECMYGNSSSNTHTNLRKAHRHSRRPSFLQRRDSKPPEEQPTEGEVKNSGNRHRKKVGNSLDDDFQLHKSKDFRNGRVLMVLWSEPVGSGVSGATYEEEMGTTKPSKYGENAYHSVRRFVIAKKMEGHCIGLPILTYGNQGTAKPGVKYKDHAIIYTGEQVPEKLEGERTLVKKPVRMDNYDERYILAKESRINYKKTYTIEHNIRVCFIGKIHKDSEHIFFTEARRLFDNDEELAEETEEQSRT